MTDNFPITPGIGRNAATDEVTYSGDTSDVQLMRLVQVTGAEGSKTVVNLPGDATDGLLVNLGANNDVTVSGVSTAANQSTIIGHVDGIEGLVTSIETDTSALADTVTYLGATTYTEGASRSLPASAVRRDADTSAVNTDNEFAPLLVDVRGFLKVSGRVATTFANGQVNISNTAATLLASRTTRLRVTFVNRMPVAVFVGIATVTTANGFQLDPGASITLEASALIQGITAAATAGTVYVHYIEEYT